MCRQTSVNMTAVLKINHKIPVGEDGPFLLFHSVFPAKRGLMERLLTPKERKIHTHIVGQRPTVMGKDAGDLYLTVIVMV